MSSRDNSPRPLEGPPITAVVGGAASSALSGSRVRIDSIDNDVQLEGDQTEGEGEGKSKSKGNGGDEDADSRFKGIRFAPDPVFVEPGFISDKAMEQIMKKSYANSNQNFSAGKYNF